MLQYFFVFISIKIFVCSLASFDFDDGSDLDFGNRKQSSHVLIFWKILSIAAQMRFDCELRILEGAAEMPKFQTAFAFAGYQAALILCGPMVRHILCLIGISLN